MKKAMCKSIGLWCLTLLLSAAAWGQAVEIKLKDGSKWRGQITDVVQIQYVQHGVHVPVDGKVVKIEPLYVVVEGMVAGVKKQTTIFKTDIISMSTTEAGTVLDSSSAEPVEPAKNLPSTPANPAKASPNLKPAPTSAAGRPLGVFVLPMEGPVGETYRHEEVVKMGEYVDKNYGPGQIIVLLINSGGGTVEMEKVHVAICDLKKKHRVVAWIKEAISAAAASASACDEIYFMTGGTYGAMTGFANGVSLQGVQLEAWMETAGKWFEAGGRSKHIAHAMIEHNSLLSYDKDPVTGVVTWHDDLSGEFDLSDAKANLVFNASNALHSGFSKGTADTTEELAKLLNLPEWIEISDYGRRLAKDWQRTCEDAKRALTMLGPRLQYKNASGDPARVIGTRIELLEEAVRWWDKCHNVCESMLPPKEDLLRQIADYKQQLASLRDN